METFHKESQIELLKASQGEESQAKGYLQTSPAIPIDLGEFLSSLGSQRS